LLILVLPILCKASSKEPGNAISYLNYTQNKGQWDAKILFKSDFKGGSVFLESTAFTFVLKPADGIDLHAHTLANGKMAEELHQFHALKMEFEGATPSHTVETEGQQTHYVNYFIGNNPKKWAGNVPLFNKVNYVSLYPGIDAKIFGRGNNLRYDLIISPGADPSLIQLKFSGQDQLSLRNGDLIIKTSVGEFVQEAPYVYQELNGRKQKVECSYTLSENKISFSLDNYNKNLPLIIDPTFVFATYTGATSDNWGASASYDALGNAYTAGISFNTGYPTTTGAFQSSFQGGSVGGPNFDISLSKFSPNGNLLLYSTYLGATSKECPQSITVDNVGNLIVLARTNSNDFPVTPGAFDTGYHGGLDIVISKFNTTGTALIGSTFVGGSADDGVNITDAYNYGTSLKHNYADDGRGAIHVDNGGNIYVSSSTSSADFPSTGGSYQPAIAGMQDGCVFKMNPALTSMIYCTFLGGSQNDAAYNLAIDSYNQVYITGGTESANFPVSSVALQKNYSGSIDGFITHLNFSGGAIIRSSFIGTNAYEQSYFVQTDKRNNVYLYGQCSGNYTVSPGVYSSPNSGQFIHKLNPGLDSTRFSTMFGGGTGMPDIAPSAFLVDNCDNIYISGWGGSLNGQTSTTSGLPVTLNAFQAATDGNDFYFAVFSKNMAGMLYATYFGGSVSKEHVDGGTSCFDKSGVVYQAICESCGGNQDMPVTPGVWSGSNGSFNCNNAVVKFKMDIKLTVAQLSLNPYVTAGCAPFNVNFLNNSINAVHYQWDLGDGSPVSTQTTTSHIYNIPGTYTVTLIASDSSTCNQRDTTHIVLTVYPGGTLPPMANKTICKGDSAQLQIFPSQASYTWQPAGSLSNANISNPKAFPVANTVYTVTIGDTTCLSSVSSTVSVNVMVNNTSIVSHQQSMCLEDSVQLIADKVYSSYSWSTGQTSFQITASQAGLYVLNTVDANGCKGSDSVTISGGTHVPLLPGNTTICDGKTASLNSISGATSYQWSPTLTLSDPAVFNPVASPSATTVYSIAVNNDGCITYGTFTVNVNPTPTLNVTASTTLILPGEFATLYALSNQPVYWDVNYWQTCSVCDTVEVSPEVNTVFHCEVTNQYGCGAIDSIKINITPTFYIPNCFTPGNDDDLNEIFKPIHSGYLKIQMMIFDRWGEKVYSTEELEGGWDGKYRGSMSELGVYTYKIIAEDYLGYTIHRVGTVTLLR
jgi:gliding motility-associated-like protein